LRREWERKNDHGRKLSNWWSMRIKEGKIEI
jgi:hypothetical protein